MVRVQLWCITSHRHRTNSKTRVSALGYTRDVSTTSDGGLSVPTGLVGDAIV